MHLIKSILGPIETEWFFKCNARTIQKLLKTRRKQTRFQSPRRIVASGAENDISAESEDNMAAKHTNGSSKCLLKTSDPIRISLFSEKDFKTPSVEK